MFIHHFFLYFSSYIEKIKNKKENLKNIGRTDIIKYNNFLITIDIILYFQGGSETCKVEGRIPQPSR